MSPVTDQAADLNPVPEPVAGVCVLVRVSVSYPIVAEPIPKSVDLTDSPAEFLVPYPAVYPEAKVPAIGV